MNNITGNFLWQTNTSNVGNHSIVFNVSNGFNSTSVTVNVTVLPLIINPPIIGNLSSSYTVNENQTLVIQLNSTNPSNNLTVVYVTNAGSILPSNFTFNNLTGTFVWRPTFSDSGNYTIIFTATAGNLTTSRNTTIFVMNVNTANLTVSGNVSAGSTVVLNVSDAGFPNTSYILAMALGNSPGIPLSDGRVIPLNGDGVFFLSVFSGPLIGLNNAQGVLDADGRATVVWNVPPITLPPGLQIYFAFVTINPSLPVPQAILSISNNAVLVTQ